MDLDRRGLCEYYDCRIPLYDSCDICNMGICWTHLSNHSCGSSSSSSSSSSINSSWPNFSSVSNTATATKKNAEENCSQPQSSSIRNYTFRDKAKINHFFRPSDSKNVEPPVGQTQRKVVSLLHTQVQPTKMFEYINFSMMTVTAVYTACDHFREE